jgi:hypothetical protein
MTVFFQKLTAFYELMAWLASPSVMPYLGALFAVVAAVTVAPRSWLSFSRAVTRVLVVALVWLVLAWIYHAGAAAFGQREGTGAAAQAAGSSVGGPEPSAHVPTPPAVDITPDRLGDLPPHCILRIGFIPLATDPSLPRDFSCFVQCRSDAATGSPSSVTVIEANDMEEFVTHLVRHLREVPIADVSEPVIQIRKSPYPGEGVLRMVKQKLEIVAQQRAIEARIEDETTEL